MQFSKLCWNLCSIRWLKPRPRQVSSINPFGLKILNTLFCTGEISNSNLLLKTEIDSEFLILLSKSTQSFKVAGKKECLKQSVQQWEIGVWLFLVLIVWFHFRIKLIR